MAMHFVHCEQPKYEELPAEIRNDQRWYTAPNGDEYPSVTTVLGHGPKPWLEAWRESMGEEAADAETERCALRGTAVHEMAENYLDNKVEFTKAHTLQNVKLFNQLKVRLNKINNIRAQEIPLFSHTLKLAGRVDCIGEYDGVLSVIDFKTSNNNKNLEMVNDYFLQCTAYSLMYEEMFGTRIDQIVVMIAVERGMVPMVYVKDRNEYIKPLVERINTFYADMKEQSA